MANTSIPAAITYLYGLASALTPNYDGATQVGLTVSDGYPVDQEPDIFCVGGSTQLTEDGGQDWADLGARHIYEEYEVELIVSCWRGGVNQKLARDAAFNLWNQFETAWRADISLGTAVIFSSIVKFSLEQTTIADAAQGRTATITAHVRCKARI